MSLKWLIKATLLKWKNIIFFFFRLRYSTAEHLTYHSIDHSAFSRPSPALVWSRNEASWESAESQPSRRHLRRSSGGGHGGGGGGGGGGGTGGCRSAVGRTPRRAGLTSLVHTLCHLGDDDMGCWSWWSLEFHWNGYVTTLYIEVKPSRFK